MHRHRWFLAAILAVVTAVPVMAQNDDPERPPQRDGKREDGRRGRRGDRPGRRPRGAEAQLDRLTAELKLDETQKREISVLLKAHEDEMRQMRQANRPTEEEQNEMRAIRDELQAAREENNQDKIAEIRERIRKYRERRMERMAPVQESIAAAEKKLHDEILGKLNSEQTESFETVWSDVMTRGRRGPDRRFDPRQLHNTVMKLDDLTDDQKQQIEKLFDEFRSVEREQRGRRKPGAERGDAENGDKEAKGPRRGPRGRDGARGPNPAVKKLYDDVMAVLSDTQKVEVEKKMSSRDRGRRGARGERGGRDGREDRGRFKRPGEKQPESDENDDG